MGMLKRAWSPSSISTPEKWLVDGIAGPPTAAGVAVNEETALYYSPFFAGINVIANDVASLPLPLYRRLDRGKERALDHPLYGVLHDQANPLMSSLSFRRTLQGHGLTWGDGYAYMVSDNAGRVVELWPLHPGRIYPDKAARGNGRFDLWWVYYDPDLGIQTRLAPDEVLHIAGLGGDGLQVLDGVDRPADREHGAHGVGDRSGGDDLAGAYVAFDQVGEGLRGAVDGVPHAIAESPHRSRAGDRHAERLGGHVHGVRGSQAGADPWAADGGVGELGQRLGRRSRQRLRSGLQEHLLDVGVTALREAAALVAAGNDHGGHVQPAGGHEVRGRRLVTGAEADHRVELGTLHHHLDVVGDQVPGRKDVPAAAAGAGDEVRRCRGTDLEGQHPEPVQLLLEHVGDVVEVSEARGEVVRRVDDGDLRPLHFRRVDPERDPLCTAGHGMRAGGRKVAAQSHGRSSSGRTGTVAPLRTSDKGCFRIAVVRPCPAPTRCAGPRGRCCG